MQEEIKKMIPPCLVESLIASGLSLVVQNGQLVITPSTGLLVIDENGVSGFLAQQILEMKEVLMNNGNKND